MALAKLVYGIISHSAAMEADGFHSLFDGASNVIGLVGMWFAARPADAGHPYGHAKFETVAAAVIGIMLAFAGYTVGKGAVDSLTGSGVADRGHDDLVRHHARHARGQPFRDDLGASGREASGERGAGR